LFGKILKKGSYYLLEPIAMLIQPSSQIVQ